MTTSENTTETTDSCPQCGAPLKRGPFGYVACSENGPGHYSAPARPKPIQLDGCTCGGIADTGAHAKGCPWGRWR